MALQVVSQLPELGPLQADRIYKTKETRLLVALELRSCVWSCISARVPAEYKTSCSGCVCMQVIPPYRYHSAPVY